MTPNQWICVDTTAQQLHLLHQQQIVRTYPVSTAVRGVGQVEGSGQTPLGWHSIQEKIGEGADPLAIFESRMNSGRLALLNEGTSCIVARILRLQGLEKGYNQGTNGEGVVVDTLARYIYIHGTNDVCNLGRAASEGCVRMAPGDMIDLFDRVVAQTLVYLF